MSDPHPELVAWEEPGAISRRVLAPIGSAIQLDDGRRLGLRTTTALGRAFTRLGRGRVGRALRSGPVGPWVHTYRSLLRGAALGLAVLAFVLLDQPTGRDVLIVALGLVLVLGVIEFLGQQPEPPTHGVTTAADTPG